MANTDNLTRLILRAFLQRESFCRRALPHIKPEYFLGADRQVFDLIARFVAKYNKLPNRAALEVEFEANSGDYNQGKLEEITAIVSTLDDTIDGVDDQWLLDKTEKWCKDRAVHIALIESIEIIDGRHKEKTEGAIPDILTQALAVSFDSSIGHDFLDDAEKRYEFYHRIESRVPTGIGVFDQITRGGTPKKTLNLIMASTGGCKSLIMGHIAGQALLRGQHVLYITLEMAEERIAERIDANLMDVALDDLEQVSQQVYTTKIDKLRKRTQGKLIVKEYPTGSAHVGHFRALLNELKMKRQFKPDLIVVDYVNICASSRLKGLGGSVGSYNLVKCIAEEIRGLAVEFDVPIWSATQTNREGYKNSDVDMDNVSESFGLAATTDLLVGVMSTEQLDAAGQLLVKQLKNRYSDPASLRRFLIGVDKSKMRVFDVENTTEGLVVVKGESASESNGSPFGQKSKDFSGFKV